MRLRLRLWSCGRGRVAFQSRKLPGILLEFRRPLTNSSHYWDEIVLWHRIKVVAGISFRFKSSIYKIDCYIK